MTRNKDFSYLSKSLKQQQQATRKDSAKEAQLALCGELIAPFPLNYTIQQETNRNQYVAVHKWACATWQKDMKQYM
jgi:hypothetical protein